MPIDPKQVTSTCCALKHVYVSLAGADDNQQTAYVLLECVDFISMEKRRENPEDVIRSIISKKTGGNIIAIRCFDKQEAVAVMLTLDDAIKL